LGYTDHERALRETIRETLRRFAKRSGQAYMERQLFWTIGVTPWYSGPGADFGPLQEG
jgi:hypothetical protein